MTRKQIINRRQAGRIVRVLRKLPRGHVPKSIMLMEEEWAGIRTKPVTAFERKVNRRVRSHYGRR